MFLSPKLALFQDQKLATNHGMGYGGISSQKDHIESRARGRSGDARVAGGLGYDINIEIDNDARVREPLLHLRPKTMPINQACQRSNKRLSQQTRPTWQKNEALRTVV